MKRVMVFLTVGLAFALGSQAFASDPFVLDFNTDPSALGVVFTGTSQWRTSGGVDDTGYLSVTGAEARAHARAPEESVPRWVGLPSYQPSVPTAKARADQHALP